MVKLRQAKFCNLKLFLMFLVIFGHLIERNEHWLYYVIYSFHMPAFAMLSGVFSQYNPLNMAKKLLLWYAVLQGAAVLLAKATIVTPYWHLWYLLSNVFWLVIAEGLLRLKYRKCWFLLSAVIIGCAVGYVPQIGRVFSASRTVTFFPYFWFGRCFAVGISRENRKAPIIFAVLSAILILIFVKIPTEFFYHAMPYGEVRYGAVLRLLCYGIGFAICLFLLAFVPDRRFTFTKAGNDTLIAYLAHAPIVLLIRSKGISVLGCLIITVGLLWLFHKLQQESRHFCGIVGKG